MAEDVKPDVIKKTQEALGKFIKKPTLTEKLLKKPPFRFLHDICTSVMKETGFFEDVLNTPQDKIENIKDKEGKIMFLQKVIATVENGSGIKQSVKPSKIVAGLEATKTNELLQALGKAVEKQAEIKSLKTTQQSKTKPSKKTTKEIKEEPPDKKKTSSSKSSKKVVENGVHEQNEEIIHSSRVPSPKKKHSSKKIEESESKPDNKKMVIENHKDGEIESKSPEKKGKKNREEKANFFGAGESKDVPDINYVTLNRANGQGDQDINTKEEVAQESETKKGHSGKHKHRRPSIQSAVDQAKLSEALENAEKSKLEIPEEKTTLEKSSKPENLIKDEILKTPSPSKQNSFPKKEGTLVREGTLISRPRTGIRPTTARPASARPAAPRIRDRGEVTVVEEIMKPASGKVQVIEDKEANNEAEEENLISLETTNDIILEEPSPSIPPTTSNTEQEHGHLVEQILEAQRELEEDEKTLDPKAQPKIIIEWENNKNKETTSKDMEKLRSNIQLLTRTTNPLGKLLDFFQEDIDTVQKELEFWKEKNSKLSLQIAQERSITEQYVEPLKIHLKELQQSIDEQLEQISVVKANIIRNNEKITKLLTGL